MTYIAPLRQSSQLILADVLYFLLLFFFLEKSQINICLHYTKSERPALWADMLALGQSDKMNTANLKSCDPHTQL